MTTLMERSRRTGYNCAHFFAEAWAQETGQDVTEHLQTFMVPGKLTAERPLRHYFERLAAPQSPCLVLFRRGAMTPHVGLFVRGLVLHLAHQAPVRQPLDIAGFGFTSTRFYAPRPVNH